MASILPRRREENISDNTENFESCIIGTVTPELSLVDVVAFNRAFVLYFSLRDGYSGTVPVVMPYRAFGFLYSQFYLNLPFFIEIWSLFSVLSFCDFCHQ